MPVLDRNLIIVLFCTFAAFCTLYAPQPLQPLLATAFAVSASQTTLLITVTLLPLGIAPVFYGYFLQAVPAKLMLSIALALLTINQISFLLVDEFWHLLVLRFMQGLLLPAIFTALMTYCSTMAAPHKVRSVMTYYIASTILGGFAGRAVGGVVADIFNWQSVFIGLSLLSLIAWLSSRWIDADTELDFARLSINSITRTLKSPLFANAFGLISVAFFVFAAILNLLPFRINETSPDTSTSTIAVMYTGYLVGSLLSINSIRLSRLAGSDIRLLSIALGILLCGVLLHLVSSTTIIFAAMFILAAGFFVIHSTLSSYLNQVATTAISVVNGLYVSIYYISGALGSWLPAYLYQHSGWHGLIYGLFAFGLCGFLLLNRIANLDK